MQKKTLLLILFIFANSMMVISEQVTADSNGEKRTFNHIILVTYDGAQKYWIDTFMENGTLSNLAALKEEGVEITLRITDHDPKTDPGMACIESGYGPDVTGIDRNFFGANIKLSIPEGLTTTERIKAVYGDSWKTGLVMPWTQDFVNVTTTADSVFWNQREETDYWFSSENVTWSQSNQNSLNYALSYGSALLRANFIATQVAEFIFDNKDSNFYVRTHFVEPDVAGHPNTDESPQYKQALIECDEALGIIIDALKDTGIYDETVILVSTDHGFKGVGHGPPTYPFGDPDITETWLISNDPEVTNELGWGLQNDIAPTCLGLAGIDPSTFQPLYNITSRALPLWEANRNNREMTSPSISNVAYPESVPEGETFKITMNIQDLSGISTAQIRYIYREPFGTYGTIWRTKSLTQEKENSFSGILGPFIEGTEVTWYLRAADNSPGLNTIYYPEDRTGLVFIVKERVTVETNPPVITDITYSASVLGGEVFNVSAKVQDESGVASIQIYYSFDSEWNQKGLTQKGDGIYEGTIGPFDSGTEVKWYLNATNNSANYNMAFYPSDNQPLIFMVRTEGGGGFPFEFIVVGGVLAVIIVLLMLYRLRRV
jgi:hypothetical protein